MQPKTIHTVTVPYAGGEERRGPVTMGQANMIRCILRDDPAQINIHDVWSAPPEARLDAAIDALRVLVVRHEALRTTFPQGSGAAPCEQVVAPEGEFTVTVLDHDALPPDTGPYAEAVAHRARGERFALEKEFGLRISLVTLHGTPVLAVVVASHAVADGSALAVLRDEWLTLLAGEDLPPLAALTPLDLAAEEATPAGLRKSRASLGYWEQIIRTGPQAMFAEPGATGVDVRLPQLTLRSRRGARALALVAERTGGLPSTVLLTAWCALVAHRAGQSTCVAAVPTSNRFLPRLARSVNTVSQDALLSLDVRVPSFDALLRKAWGAALNAYRHSRFDAVGLWEMIGRTTFERGSHFARDVVFNDVSTLPANLALAAAEDGAGPDLELSWGPAQVLPTRSLVFVHQTAPLLRLSMWADPALFPRDEAEGFLEGLVRLLEAAGAEDVPFASLTDVTGIHPARRGADWVQVDGSWISPPAVAQALSRALDGLPVHVALDAPAEGAPTTGALAADTSRADTPAEDAGQSLTAFIASGGSPLTPAKAHSALMDVLPGRPDVLAPRRYVIVQDPPTGADRTSAWLRQQILMEGNGRERSM